MRRNWHSRKGTSILEVMVVVAIVVTLMVVMAGSAVWAWEHFAVKHTEIAILQTDEHLRIVELDRALPSTAEGLAAVYEDGVPKDGWDRELGYEKPGPKEMDYDITSMGRDGEAGGSGFSADIKLSEMRR